MHHKKPHHKTPYRILVYVEKVKKIEKIAAIVIFCILLFSLCANSLALSSDKKLPYHIVSQSATQDSKQKTTTFIGEVNITQGTTTLLADKSILYRDAKTNSINKMWSIGNPARYSTLPDGKKTKLFCDASQLIYYPLKHIMLLIGNAEVTQNGNVLKGERISYNIDKQRIESISNGAKRNQLLLQPNQKPTKSETTTSETTASETTTSGTTTSGTTSGTTTSGTTTSGTTTSGTTTSGTTTSGTTTK